MVEIAKDGASWLSERRMHSPRGSAAGPHAWARHAGPGLLTTICGLAVLAGCANQHGQLVEFLRSHEVAVAAGQYVVQPPDELTLHSPTSPELDGVAQRIRSDGKLALRLLGEVDVAGLTTVQVADRLKALLARYYVDPEVVVEVTGYRSKVYYVFGEVDASGPKPFTGRDTILRALAESRPTRLAWTSQIRVLRPSPDGKAKSILTVDLDKMRFAGSTEQNFLLQEGDIIDVPPTPLAWVGLRVRDLLYPVEPAIDAYTKPANTIDAYHTYRGEDDD